MLLIRSQAHHPVASRTGFTAVGIFSSDGRTVSQTQTFNEDYVVTQIDRGTFIYIADQDERFLVDLAKGCLRRIEATTGRIQRDTLRSVIGEVSVRHDDSGVEVDGFLCQRYNFSNDNPRIVLEGETLATRIPGIELTALPAEREHDAAIQPFSLPLEVDHLVVRSTLRSSAGDLNQVQSYRLVTVRAGIDEPDRFEEWTRLPIFG